MQDLIFAAREDQTSLEEQLNVGIIRPYASPFNLFLNLGQLVDPDMAYVYFFVYSLGKQRVMLWGVYDKNEHEFFVDGGCRYTLNQLKRITDRWIKNGYKYTANSVKDRITPLVKHYLDEGIMSYEDYVDKKRLLRYLRGELSEEAMEKKYGANFLYEMLPENVDPQNDHDLDEYALFLEVELGKYEKIINRTDLNMHLMFTLAPVIKRLVDEITAEFEETIQRGKFDTQSYQDKLNDCPELEACQMNSTESCNVYYYGDRVKYELDEEIDFT